MEVEEPIYGYLDLHFDNRFTNEEKQSIVNSNPDVFERGIWKDASICIAGRVIMDLIIQMRENNG